MSLITQKEIEDILRDYQKKKEGNGCSIEVYGKIENDQKKKKDDKSNIEVYGQEENDQKLLRVTWSSNDIDIEIDSTDQYEHRLLNVLDYSGLYDLNLEFLPSSNLYLQEEKDSYISPKFRDGTLRKSMETFSEYGDWLKQIVSLYAIPKLIPDTNFLCRRYYSHFLKPVMPVLTADKSMKANLRIGISRLTILELERWKNDQKAKPNLKKEQKEKLAFLSLGELLTIKNDKNSLLFPQLENTMLESFSSVAGSGFADVLIRREISQYPDCFILTSDLMNAFAANAENLNVIYFSRISQMKSSSEIVERLASLVYNVSIELGHCTIDLIDYKKFDITGMWEGKTPDIWKNNITKIKFYD